MNKIDLTGVTFGRLTVIKRQDSIKNAGKSRTRWECICSCGQTKIALTENLKSGNTQSCGCISLESPHNKIHGFRHHLLYGVWKGIKERCYNKNSKAYNRYGGIGIIMCEEWINNPQKFIEWALINGWKHGMEIDKDKIPIQLGIRERIYSPEMCSVLTLVENANYKYNSRNIEAFGSIKTLSQWARIYNINVGTLKSRLNMGWDTEKAISTPKLQTWKRRY